MSGSRVGGWVPPNWTRSAPKANCARGVMDLNSEGVSLQDDDSGYSPERVLCPSGDVSASVDVDASLQSAWQSLQDRGPQQIWEDGFWSQVFGNQSQAFLAPAFTQFDRPMQIGSFAEIPEDESSVLGGRTLKKPRTATDLFLQVVKKGKQISWQDEREARRQCALKKWLELIYSWKPDIKIRVWIDECVDLQSKLDMLEDVFAGKAPQTLMKRANSMTRFCKDAADMLVVFPCTESEAYMLLYQDRINKGPASRRKAYLEAFAFCKFVLNVDEITPVLQSKRCFGTAVRNEQEVLKQASPLLVCELVTLHGLTHDKSSLWDAVFAGAVLFVVYARARWSDAQHVEKIIADMDFEEDTIAFIEGRTSVHKSLNATAFKHRMLPLVAITDGVRVDKWAEDWLDCRRVLGIRDPPEHPLMPAPDETGAPTVRPLDSSEAGEWSRAVLVKAGHTVEGRKLTSHSLKATCLSFAAKRGFSQPDRLTLGYHAHQDMAHRYARDAMSRPLQLLSDMMREIREGVFVPDNKRSGRLMPKGATEVGKGSSLFPTPKQAPAPFSLVEDTASLDPLPAAQQEVPQNELESVASSDNGISSQHALGSFSLVEEATSTVQPGQFLHSDSTMLVDLMSQAREILEVVQHELGSAASSDNGVTSSSRSDSEPDLESPKVCKPPEAVVGSVMVQHKKWRTVHLVPEGFKKFLQCGRALNEAFSWEPQLRWDTPKCRQCFKSAVSFAKASGRIDRAAP